MSLITTSIASFATYGICEYFQQRSDVINRSQVLVEIDGAVYKKGSYYVSSGTLLKSVVRQAQPKMGIDWSAIDNLKEIQKDIYFYVPFLEGYSPKYKLKNGISEQQIEQLNVNKTIRQAIKNLLKNNPSPNWNDFDNIPGVGEKTLEILKMQIEI